MEQLTINTAMRICDTPIFASRKSVVNGQMSMVKCSPRGFTLVEMIVSLGLFTIVMFIATSAFLSIVNADRKSRSVRIATDNLNIALEDMSRRIKTGINYYCGTTDTGGVADCLGGGSTLFFTNQEGERVKYTLTDGSIWRTKSNTAGIWVEQAIKATSPEINVSNLKFIVSGSLPCGGATPCTTVPSVSDAKQPMVTILIDGALGAGVSVSAFKIQTTVTQRAYDN